MIITWHTRFSFSRTAADLENEHLKATIDMAVELFEILKDKDTSSEPSFWMWHKHMEAFLVYGMLLCNEWTQERRYGGKEFWVFSREADRLNAAGEFRYEPPPWFKDADVCRSHRSVLKAVAPAAYGADAWAGTPEKMPLLWPVVSEDGAVAELKVARADLPRIKSGELKVPNSIRGRVVNL